MSSGIFRDASAATPGCCQTCATSSTICDPASRPSETPCAWANVQLRSASSLSPSGVPSACLNVKNPGREKASRHAGCVRATSCLSAVSAPLRQVMNTNGPSDFDIKVQHHYNKQYKSPPRTQSSL